MRAFCLAFAALACATQALPQAVRQGGDWPVYGHDPGGSRYSPLDQITAKNVHLLQRAWTYHTGERGRAFEVTPIVVDGVLYFATQNQKIVALEPETGKEIWTFDPKSNAREIRGVTYWPGERQTPPRILFGTGDGRLIALDAKTGVPVPGFGDNGVVNLKAGLTDKFPRAIYGITSPPAALSQRTDCRSQHPGRTEPRAQRRSARLRRANRETPLEVSHGAATRRTGQRNLGAGRLERPFRPQPVGTVDHRHGARHGLPADRQCRGQFLRRRSQGNQPLCQFA